MPSNSSAEGAAENARKFVERNSKSIWAAQAAQHTNDLLQKEALPPYDRDTHPKVKDKPETQALKRKRDPFEGQDGDNIGDGSLNPEEQPNFRSFPVPGTSNASAAPPTSIPRAFFQDNRNEAVNQELHVPPAPGNSFQSSLNQDDLNIDPRLRFNHLPPLSGGEDHVTQEDAVSGVEHDVHPGLAFGADVTAHVDSRRDNINQIWHTQEQDVNGLNDGFLLGQQNFSWQYRPISAAATDLDEPIASTINNMTGSTMSPPNDNFVAHGCMTGFAPPIGSVLSNTTDHTLPSFNINPTTQVKGIATGLVAPIANDYDITTHPIHPNPYPPDYHRTGPPLIKKLRDPIPAPKETPNPAGVPEQKSPNGRWIDVPGIPTRKATRPSVLRAVAETDHFKFIELYPNDLDSEFGWIVATRFKSREEFIQRLHSFHDLPTQWLRRCVDGNNAAKGEQFEEVVLVKLQNKISKWYTKWGAYFGRIPGWRHTGIMVPPEGFLDPWTWREDGCHKPKDISDNVSQVKLPTEAEVVQRERHQQLASTQNACTPITIASSSARNTKRRRTQGPNTQSSSSGPSTTLPLTASPSTTLTSTTGPSTTSVVVPGANVVSSSARELLRGRTAAPSGSNSRRQNVQPAGPTITPPPHGTSMPQILSTQQDTSLHNQHNVAMQQQSDQVVSPANTSSSPPAPEAPPGYAFVNQNLAPEYQSPDRNLSAFYQTPPDDQVDPRTPDGSPIPATISMENNGVGGNPPRAQSAGMKLEGKDALMSENYYVWEQEELGQTPCLAAEDSNRIEVSVRKNLPPTAHVLSIDEQDRIDANKIAESNQNVKKVVMILSDPDWNKYENIRRAINELLDFTVGHPGVETYLTSVGVPDEDLEARDPAEYKKIETFLELLTPVMLDDQWNEFRESFEKLARPEKWILPKRLEQWETLYDDWAV